MYMSKRTAVSATFSIYTAGKWHLGHHTSDYLPTNRGFDTFRGSLLGSGYSSLSPSIHHIMPRASLLTNYVIRCD